VNRKGAVLIVATLITACTGADAVTEPRAARQASNVGSEQVLRPSSVSSAPATTIPETTTSTLAWSSLSLDDEVVVQGPQPTAIEIEAIGVTAPVVALGVVSETGQMEVPDSVDDVGWYEFGPSPGQPGSSVLAAHVDIYGEGPGVFFNLDQLVPGDRIEVLFDEGATSTFVVTSTERVAKAGLAVDSIFAPAGEPVLRLVTCGGGFDRSSRTYNDNVIVTAEPEMP